ESNIVFLGNVGFDTTEEQLRKVLELAGPVLDVRLVFDQQTNRSRGFGFCQFVDSSVASSAIKNLSDTLVDGRNLKIGFADRRRVQGIFGNAPWSFEQTPQSASGFSARGASGGGGFSASGVGGSGSGVEKVTKLVDSLDKRQKAELLAQFKGFANGYNASSRARDELVRNPGLAHALLLALESVGARVDGVRGERMPSTSSHIGQLSSRSAAAAAAGGSLSAGYLDSPRMSSTSSESPATAVNRFSASPSVPPQHILARQPVSAPPQPPRSLQPPIPPPLPSQQQQQQQPMYGEREPEMMEIDNTEVLKQLLSLTDEQLAQLPEEHRLQLLDLKRQLENAQP
ncbi:Cleavage stimulation factor subunit 2, partial [Coemansia aciculifera]